MAKSPKDNERLNFKVLGCEVSAIGRYAINCAVVLVLLWMAVAVVCFGAW
ncbi:hypothetical protein [Sinorhizobium americanum]|uniref:Transmembrane protein n=1 Tax=Sinorhizobium americanum TaxID=194963 RepID=A0A4R2BX60_9HYPH|nr:hypothetical protein [Sinorhizobium americanum]TCN32477.1 hypothetical protein EV184_104143 [Sinorhizobium americanum]